METSDAKGKQQLREGAPLQYAKRRSFDTRGSPEYAQNQMLRVRETKPGGVMGATGGIFERSTGR